MAITISDYARRPQRSAEADGLNDIIGGIGILATAFMWYAAMQNITAIRGIDYAQTQAYKESRLFYMVSIVGMFGVIFLSKWCVKIVRERFVYPRLGYVAPRIAPIVRQKIIVFALAMISPFLISRIVNTLFKTSGPWPVGTLVLILGVFSGIVYLWYFAKLGFTRHLVVAGVSVVAGLLLAALSVDEFLAIRYFTIISGTTLIIGGAVAFAKLLRTPLITEDQLE